MALKAVVSDLNSIPEADRGHYVERDGLFVANVEPVTLGDKYFALEDVGALKRTAAARGTERDALDARLKGFGDLTPEKAREALERAERLSKINPETEAAKLVKEAEDRFRTDYQTKYDNDIAPYKSEIEELTSEVRQRLISDEITKQLVAVGVVPESMPLLKNYLTQQCEVVKDKNGKRMAVVVDESRKPRISMKAGSVDSMGLDELVASARPMFPNCFIGENASGSGSSQNGSANNNGGGGVRRIPRGNQTEINAHWQDIANGKAVVV